MRFPIRRNGCEFRPCGECETRRQFKRRLIPSTYTIGAGRKIQRLAKFALGFGRRGCDVVEVGVVAETRAVVDFVGEVVPIEGPQADESTFERRTVLQCLRRRAYLRCASGALVVEIRNFAGRKARGCRCELRPSVLEVDDRRRHPFQNTSAGPMTQDPQCRSRSHRALRRSRS
jgi:hypothetical protein